MTPGNAVLADPVEERGASLYGIVHVKHGGILKPESVSTKQERIAELARNNPAMALTTLAHVQKHNRHPKPFIWTAKASDILAKVTRARAKVNKMQSV